MPLVYTFDAKVYLPSHAHAHTAESWSKYNSEVYVGTEVFALLSFCAYFLFGILLVVLQAAVNEQLGISECCAHACGCARAFTRAYLGVCQPFASSPLNQPTHTSVPHCQLTPATTVCMQAPSHACLDCTPHTHTHTATHTHTHTHTPSRPG